MPKRTDIKKILLVGSGPIVIGQACEFDYSGTQACKALREEGYTIVLVNSNPATIMTDPMMADRTYIEPLTPKIVAAIIAKEKPEALLPTLGGQTALNLASQLAEQGVLKQYSVELIGASYEAIKRAEDRLEFKKAMQSIGLDVPRSEYVSSIKEAQLVAKKIPYPLILRPSYTLGGIGGAIIHNGQELKDLVIKGLEYSPIHQVLLEESVIGWKEFELEVMRDTADNFVVICSIENLDPMGVHTGDSITVAPAQTLTDVEYQVMRDAAKKVMSVIGVDTGGSNIQFAVHPHTGRIVVIEMNPRVSRSSALASKATGFPIAKIAAKLAIGYTLDELPNDITKTTPASFEPTIDYVVTKIPRFAFEKFSEVEQSLNTCMKSVGEVMAIGRTFKESLGKALRSLEKKNPLLSNQEEEIKKNIQTPNEDRLLYIKKALQHGMSITALKELSLIDPWFLDQIKQCVELEAEITHLSVRRDKNKKSTSSGLLTTELLCTAKQYGFSDREIGTLCGMTESEVRKKRYQAGIIPHYKIVDTCAAEFPSFTPYYYSTYDRGMFFYKPGKVEQFPEKTKHALKVNKKKVVILGSGPNRIGQGIEFDYCCVHASYTLRDLGYESIMVNCNPETVSTDYDTSSRLYFEPITVEDVLAIVDHEKPLGVIVQFGGQTPINIVAELGDNGVKILGTDIHSIDLAEDREQFGNILHDLALPRPAFGTARSISEALTLAHKIGYPVIVRPSYVLGGRAMEIIYSDQALERYMQERVAEVSSTRPIFIDQFLQDAIELDVDALCDGDDVYIAGIMEHVEEAGIHSGDSACVIPPMSIGGRTIEQVKSYTRTIARALKTVGCLNIQMALKDRIIYILEVNPRASRTLPFVSKATGVPLVKYATQIIMGKKLSEVGLQEERAFPAHVSVKEVVLPFVRFIGSDTALGPEMKSTGEVMGIAPTFEEAFAKAEIGAGVIFPQQGKVFISVSDQYKKAIVSVAERLTKLGFSLLATENTARYLQHHHIAVERIYKVSESQHPNIVDLIKQGDIALVVNTPSGESSRQDGYVIRTNSIRYNLPLFTTIPAVYAMVDALESMQKKPLGVKALQEYYS